MVDPSQDLDLASLAAELSSFARKLKRRLREQVDHGDYPWSQLTVLARLDREGPATVTSLAKAEGVRSQSMSATIAALGEAGLIEGAPNPLDGRQTLWSLNPETQQKIKAARAAREEWLRQALEKNLNRKEQALVAQALPLLMRIADR